MFLFQLNLSEHASKAPQDSLAGLITAQQSLMSDSSPQKSSKKDVAASINSVYNACMAIKKNEGNAFSPDQKKEFFSFVETWLPWADKALKANAGSLAKGDKAVFDGLLNGISAERLFYSNLNSVHSMYEDYSGGKPLSEAQAGMFASFLTKMADKSVMNYYQCRLLVGAMMEVVSGRSPDNWAFNFATAQDAKDFTAILGALPGFTAKNVQQTGNAISFSLKPAIASQGEFVLPESIAEKKGKPAAGTGGVAQKASSMSITHGDAATSEIYITSKEEAAKSGVSDNPTSFMVRSASIAGSAALLYGEGYETDERDSYAFASLKAKEMIYNLAQRFGFTISEPFEDWMVSTKDGGGQAFIAKLNEAKITLDVVGSADMAVFFDGKNSEEFAAAAGKNQLLSEKRSGLVIKYLTGLNNTVLANSENKLEFSNTPKGRLHFFQDFTADEVKNLNLSKYGYAEGEGAKNMAALMNYLKASFAADERTGAPHEFVQIGQNTFSFTDKERKDAQAFQAALAKIVNEDGTLKQGAVGDLNTYFRRMDGDPSLKGAGTKGGMIYEGRTSPKGKEKFIAPNVFARAIMESTEVSSRSVSLSSKVEAELSVKSGGGSSVKYTINGVDVDFNDRNGTTETGTVKTPDGSDRTVIVAFTKDGSLNSGYAWETVKAEEKLVMHNTVQAFGRNVPGRKNEYNTIPFYAVNNVTMPGEAPYREKVDVRVAFVAMNENGGLGFLAPGRNVVSKEACYFAGGREVAIVRGITLDGKEYSKADMLSLLNSKAIGIMSGSSVIALDGTTELIMQDNWVTKENGAVYDPSVKQSLKKVVVRKGMVSGQEFGKPKEFHKDEYLIPYYGILPTKDVEFGKGGEKMSPKQVERLAKQGYTGLIRMDGDYATVFDLNGNRLGLYKEADEAAPKVKGIYCYVPKELQTNAKNAAEKGAPSEDVPYWFNYPQKVYGPSDAALLHGIIRPVTRFNEEEVK